MNKRQKKKKQKKYLPIIADEFNLLTMTIEERNKADKEFDKFRERFAYRKKYKDLKEGKPLRYFYPPGQKFSNAIKDVSNLGAGGRTRKLYTATQSMDDFK